MRVSEFGSHVKAIVLLTWFTVAVTTSAEAFQSSRPKVNAESYLNLDLRHIFHHGTYRDPGLHRRLDVTPKAILWTSTEQNDRPAQQIPVRLQSINIHRLADRRLSQIESYLSLARNTGEAATLDASYWTTDEVFAPNISDQSTVVSLAKAASNAYVETRDDAAWEDLPIGWNASVGFGWQGDGLRGYIFADPGNSTVLVALKGTSPAVFDGEGTTTQDKLNDNLFFSCCCAQGGRYFWRQVCNCYKTTYTCNQTCLRKALKDEHRYYRAAIELYSNVTMLYPDSTVWLTGHSLGGSVSSLLGLTFGIPTVTFEAPGEALAASRLGLPNPPDVDRPAARKQTAAFHFGHTADPVFMGSCNGLTAPCTLGGYAMETQCHTGMQCVYDTVTDFGWRVGLGYHKIKTVIDSVLLKYDKPPRCEPDEECVDCFNWKYFESNESIPSTTSLATTTKSTRTRTATCKTPGWWGCLDQTTSMATTSTTSTSTSSSSSSSSTCRTPGWFGCNDPTMTTFSTHPGHTIAHTPMSTSTQAPSLVSSTTRHSTSCETPGWFWGCHDKTSTTSTVSMTAITPAPLPSQTIQTMARVSCAQSHFFGWFCDRWVTQTLDQPTGMISDHSTTSWRDEM